MSEWYDKSPSAFPNGVKPGMSLRDYFAGQALTGLLAHTSGEAPNKAPALAYHLADMMIKERAQPPETE